MIATPKKKTQENKTIINSSKMLIRFALIFFIADMFNIVKIKIAFSRGDNYSSHLMN